VHYVNQGKKHENSHLRTKGGSQDGKLIYPRSVKGKKYLHARERKGFPPFNIPLRRELKEGFQDRGF